jgi:tetrahydromethanopterin S-methyltransferase subunit C
MVNRDEPRNESIIGLARQAVSGAIGLARLEMQHGRQEVQQRIGTNARAMMFFAIAAVFGLLALIALVCTLVLALAILLPGWLAALIWLIVFAIIGAVLAFQGRRRLRNPVPQETIASVKEDIAWAKRLIRRE